MKMSDWLLILMFIKLLFALGMFAGSKMQQHELNHAIANGEHTCEYYQDNLVCYNPKAEND